jgi:vancomycin aglycone glucosyltransferase
MRVLVSSVGTRGDVQPALALAIEVRKLRHEVRLCLPPNFMAWARELGFEVQPIGIEMRAPGRGEPPPVIPDLIADQFHVMEKAAEACDLIVGAGAHQYAARSIAELHGAAFIDAVYAPVSLPSPDVAPGGQADVFGAPETNLKLWEASKAGWNARSLDRVNAHRARLNLSPVNDVLDHILGDRVLLAADAALAPAPSAPGVDVVQTGAWLLPDASPLPPELEAFLDAGEPPLYFGFGSMPLADAANVSRMVIDAARVVGRRAILSRGWGDLEPVEGAADCIAVGDVNQKALFPRAAAIVHHGGAGTTTIAAQAGAPQIVTPMFGDQFYFGRRVGDLGIGAATPFAGMNAETLASALDTALRPETAKRARAFAGKIASDGAAIAAGRLAQLQR